MLTNIKNKFGQNNSSVNIRPNNPRKHDSRPKYHWPNAAKKSAIIINFLIKFFDFFHNFLTIHKIKSNTILKK